MKLTKRLLAMLLTVVMVLSMLPAIALTASAASSGDTFEKITSLSDLSVGDEVIFVNSAGTYAMSTTQNSNNRGQTAVSASSGTYTYSGSSVQALTVEAGSSSGTYAFNTGSGYLYSPSASNYLRTQTTKDSYASWTITANANGTFHIQCAGRTAYYMQYNSGSSIFSCYKNTQADFCIYKKAAASATTYDLTFYANEPAGTATGMPSNQTGLAENAVVDLTAVSTPSLAGYTFAGWFTAASGGSAITSITMSSDKDVYAHWTAKTAATISLSENGTPRNPGGTHYSGDSYTLPTTTNAAVPTGYVFMGWSKVTIPTAQSSAPTSNYYAKGAAVTLAGGTNEFYAVYAQASGTSEVTTWEKVTSAPSDWSGDYVIVNTDYAMTSDFFSGTSGEFKGASVTITDNKVVDPTDKMIWTVAKNGSSAQYSFQNKATGTYANITGTSSTSAALSSSAVWFTIEANTNGTWDVASVSNSARCFAYYATNTSFRTYAKSGNNTGDLYKKTTSGGTSYTNYTTAPTEPSVDTYTVTITQPSNGAITTNDTLIGLEANDYVTLTAVPDLGWEVDEWITDGNEDDFIDNGDGTVEVYVYDSDVEVTVSFKKINYTITKNAGANGSIMAAASANYQDTVNFTVTPDAGYQIATLTVTQTSGGAAVSYTDNGNGSYTISSFPAANVTIAATFSALPTYSYTIYNNSVEVDSGTAASVTAPTAPASIQYTDPDTLTTSTFTFACEKKTRY